jgi:hypothetical protein
LPQGGGGRGGQAPQPRPRRTVWSRLPPFRGRSAPRRRRLLVGRGRRPAGAASRPGVADSRGGLPPGRLAAPPRAARRLITKEINSAEWRPLRMSGLLCISAHGRPAAMSAWATGFRNFSAAPASATRLPGVVTGYAPDGLTVADRRCPPGAAHIEHATARAAGRPRACAVDVDHGPIRLLDAIAAPPAAKRPAITPSGNEFPASTVSVPTDTPQEAESRRIRADRGVNGGGADEVFGGALRVGMVKPSVGRCLSSGCHVTMG